MTSAAGPRELLRSLFAEVPELQGRAMAPDVWSVARGGAVGVVRLLPDDEDPLGGRLLVRFQVGRAPRAHSAEFHRRLLGLNHGLGGLVAFSVDEEGAPWLSAGRPLAGLDAESLAAMIALAAASAEEYAARLGHGKA